jgi:hypothetical protein
LISVALEDLVTREVLTYGYQYDSVPKAFAPFRDYMAYKAEADWRHRLIRRDPQYTFFEYMRECIEFPAFFALQMTDFFKPNPDSGKKTIERGGFIRACEVSEALQVGISAEGQYSREICAYLRFERYVTGITLFLEAIGDTDEELIPLIGNLFWCLPVENLYLCHATLMLVKEVFLREGVGQRTNEERKLLVQAMLNVIGDRLATFREFQDCALDAVIDHDGLQVEGDPKWCKGILISRGDEDDDDEFTAEKLPNPWEAIQRLCLACGTCMLANKLPTFPAQPSYKLADDFCKRLIERVYPLAMSP